MIEPSVPSPGPGTAQEPTSMRVDSRSFVDAALADADASARLSRVSIREVSDPPALDAICALFAEIWRHEPANAPVTSEMLRALAKAGNYVAGAYLDGNLVGASAGFFAAPAHGALHSHIAGVSPRNQARSIGFALKLHQRAWALRHGANVISWTFDPLVRLNAYFNLGKLGAVPAEYLPDFYGTMHDEINNHDQSDRLLVRWQLTDGSVLVACGGQARMIDATAARAEGAIVRLGISSENEPSLGDESGGALLIAVPDNIVGVRRDDPARAARWRIALREALGGAMAEGAQVAGFDRTGWYLLERGAT